MSERFKTVAGAVVTVALLGVVAFGVLADSRTPEERLADLGDRIKCPVCAGNSIIDSPHPYASDMVALVEEKIAAGESDDEILSFFEARYSDQIRLDARNGAATALWLLPVAGMAAGLWLMAGRRRRDHP